MGRRGVGGTTFIIGATAGAMVGIALMTSPLACADELPPLPVPPFQSTQLLPPGSEGVPRIIKTVDVPGLYSSRQEDIPYTLSDGNSYTVADNQQSVGGLDGSLVYHQVMQRQITSGPHIPQAAWNYSSLGVPSSPRGMTTGLAEAAANSSSGMNSELYLYQNYDLTTPAGTADFYEMPLLGLANEYYNGPAGLIDDLVVLQSGAVLPVIDIPDASDLAALGFETFSLL